MSDIPQTVGTGPGIMHPILQLQNISARYGGIVALSDVSMHVEKGQFVGVLGANGAGKSTLLNTIAGLLRPSAGSIEFNGRSITGWPAHRVCRQGTALVPEGRRVHANLTVRQNLVLAARSSRRGSEEDIPRYTDMLPQLATLMDRPAGAMSGGQQQMLAVARALITKPELVLLDEPSMGLAPVVVKDVFRVIQDIHEQGTSFIVVEQNIDEVLDCADYVYVINQGTVATHGTPRELSSQNDLAALYLGANL